jgi:hypothetical protein
VYGKGVEQDVLNGAEDGGGGADPQSEREDRDRRKSGLFAKAAQTVRKVFPQPVHLSIQTDSADGSFHVYLCAEVHSGFY